MNAADIMKRDIITVRDDLTVKELAQLFIEKHISGAPVIDGSGDLVGVVSQTDLVRSMREESEPMEAPAYHQELDRWLGRQGYQVEAPDYQLVRDVMTPAILSAETDTPVAELARCMSLKHIHRLVITRGGKLAGLVTSMDILAAVAKSAGEGNGSAKAKAARPRKHPARRKGR